MNSLLMRRLGVVLAFVILIGGFVGFRLLSQMKEPPQKKPVLKQEKVIDTLHVDNRVVATSLEVQGQLRAFDKIDIFSEVSGTMTETERAFKVGSYFPKSTVLVRLDEEEARLSLLSQRSSLLNAITQIMPDLKIDYPESFPAWERYLDQFDIEAPLVDFPEPQSRQEKNFIASRNLYTQFYTIKSAEERLSKYTIYAPFSGVLTQTSVNPGGLVRAGQKLGELMNTNSYELEATVPLADLEYLKVGNEVSLVSEDIDGEWAGRVRRINDQVDPGTQTVKVFISVGGNDLREGMYLRGQVAAGSIENAVELPRKLLVDQKSVYTLADTVLNLQPVEVVKLTPSVAVIQGLEDGTPVLKEMLPGLYDGIKVKVNPELSGRTGRSSVPVAGAVGMK